MNEPVKWHAISSTYPSDDAWDIVDNREFDSGLEVEPDDEGDEDWEDEL